MEDTLKQILNEMKGLKEDVTDLKQSQERIESKVDTLDTKVNSLDAKVNTLDTKVNTLDTKVDNLSLELRSNFKFTNDKLDDHRKVFEVVSDEMKGVNVDIEYLSSKTGKHDMEINHIINKLKG